MDLAGQPNWQNELFTKFLIECNSMICDPVSSSRWRLATTLVELGANQANMSMASSYDEARDLMKKNNPRLILCEYQLGNRSGLELLQDHRTECPDSKKNLFALVTNNTSQSAVARAAEEDVDTYILKPYTAQTLKKSIFSAAMLKLQPSPYIREIETGKEKLVAGDIDSACEHFKAAVSLDSKPTLAFFYLGQAEALKKALDKASTNYQEGLSYNKIHYKCLVGLYELLTQQQKYAEAYDIAKKIVQYFPANQKRLSLVLRLAVVTKNYDDIEGYYRIYSQIADKSADLTRYVSAALIVTGKHYLYKKIRPRALDLFGKAITVSEGKPKFLRYTVEALVDSEMVDEAKKYLSKFPQDSLDGEDYKTMKFLVDSHAQAPTKTLQQGQTLIESGILNPTIYRVLIDSCLKDKNLESAQNLCKRAIKTWPDERTFFQNKLEEISPVS